MRSRWSDEEAGEFLRRYAARWGEPLALRTYSSRLLGAEPSLVLHGGGNSSVKITRRSLVGDLVPVIHVKASGVDMATIEPDGHPGLDLAYLGRLRALPALDDESMVNELRTHLVRADSPTPSIETLAHAFLPAAYVDHTHADAILALTNRPGGDALIAEALGDDVPVLEYVTPGFELARKAADLFDRHPRSTAMVWAHHGLVTWGATAREAYEAMVRLVTRAERFLAERSRPRPAAAVTVGASVAGARLAEIGPIVRGLLASPSGQADRPWRRVVVRPLSDEATIEAVSRPGARDLLVTPPLTSDHLIRVGPLPAWVDRPAWGDPGEIGRQLGASVSAYADWYQAYLRRHEASLPPGMVPFDARPRVIFVPGLGALCAGGDERAAEMARDITAHTLAVKETIAATGGEVTSLPEDELFAMEYRSLQHAKLDRALREPLAGEVALVTGAAGAIGAGICEGLLAAGCHVAATDLAGDPLDGLVAELAARHGRRIIGVPLDVTDPASVEAAFAEVVRTWGGVDLVVPNAGIAMVKPLVDLDLEAFRRVERVNVEGTLLVLAEAARLFGRQGTGGDVVLVSTKNVFMPGATFGAYSATKAASHQLARIASQEFAPIDVRVNMVSPDAVFGDPSRRSGLWAEVGPDRMKARGLDEAGLEEYYRTRNLLKARVTAAHVAHAVLYFATRQSPTTGATLPVDGGLPDSTPR